MKIEDWKLAKEFGYEPKTKFWDDFTNAEQNGFFNVLDTFGAAFEESKNDYVKLTELVMVTNHKIWRWNKEDERLAEVYNRLWMKADAYATNNLKGDELLYFYRVTD